MGANSVASHQDYLQGINTGMAPAGASRAAGSRILGTISCLLRLPEFREWGKAGNDDIYRHEGLKDRRNPTGNEGLGWDLNKKVELRPRAAWWEYGNHSQWLWDT